jgi:hypothetical protein
MSSTGSRVSFKTGRPPTREGSISTKGQLDQSKGSISLSLNLILADFIQMKRPEWRWSIALMGRFKKSSDGVEFCTEKL